MLGYARSPSGARDEVRQGRALRAAGCDDIVIDRCRHPHPARGGLRAVLTQLGPGDVLVVTRLNRAARSLQGLAQVLATAAARGVRIRSLAEPWSEAAGEGAMVAALAAFQRGLAIEACQEGASAARSRARAVRAPLIDDGKLAEVDQMRRDGFPTSEIATLLGVHRATLYRALGARRSRAPHTASTTGRAS
jgi:DNA invertase Pin-like site-specific DNA recombinase